MSISETDFRPKVPAGAQQRREWRMLTGKLIRDITQNPELEDRLIDVGSKPVEQTLPGRAIDALSRVDAEVADFTERYGTIDNFVHQPPVPEEIIGPDLRLSNLPTETKHMVGELDREARELKLLALMAELHKQGGPTFDDQGDYFLPSGIHIHVDSKQPESVAALFNTAHYEDGKVDKRIIKDRVSKLTVGDQAYVIKEEKTNRHTDTSEHGYQPSQSSSVEYRIGRELHDSGEVQQGRIHLKWENPLGYVEYPDGYQFMVAAFEPDMITDPERSVPKKALADLEQAILTNRASFEDDYQHMTSRRPLTYQHFAAVTANRMMDEAEDIYDEVLAEHGLIPKDIKRGMGFRIHTDEDVMLEVIGYDLERMALAGASQAVENAPAPDPHSPTLHGQAARNPDAA